MNNANLHLQMVQELVSRSWKDLQFNKEAIANPATAIEKLGYELNPAAVSSIIVVDQTDPSTIFFNIPRNIDKELSEQQLDTVVGGVGNACHDIAQWATNMVQDAVENVAVFTWNNLHLLIA